MAQEERRLKRTIRNSYFVATVSIAMVLFLLGSVAYLIFSALDFTDRLKESITIQVMLADGLSSEQTEAMRVAFETEPLVRTATYITKQQAAERFIADTGDDFRDFIDYNPLPDSFELGLSSAAGEKAAVDALVESVRSMPGVSEVLYQQNIVEHIGANLGKLNFILAIFGGAILVVSLILLRNTVRMTILAKRQIINTMKLVGAGSGFIARQFAPAATVNGFWAGVVASVMLGVLVVGIGGEWPSVSTLTGDVLLRWISVAMVIAGVFISLLFTLFAVRRVTKTVVND